MLRRGHESNKVRLTGIILILIRKMISFIYVLIDKILYFINEIKKLFNDYYPDRKSLWFVISLLLAILLFGALAHIISMSMDMNELNFEKSHHLIQDQSGNLKLETDLNKETNNNIIDISDNNLDDMFKNVLQNMGQHSSNENNINNNNDNIKVNKFNNVVKIREYSSKDNIESELIDVITSDVGFASNIIEARERLYNNKTKFYMITYGERCCKQAKKRLCKHALNDAKFNKCYAYSQKDLDSDFIKNNSEYFDYYTRGAGYWLWKPYIIYHNLISDDINFGDYLVYLDAGAYPIKEFNEIFEFIEVHSDYRGVLFFGNGLSHKLFCKRDAFILQNCDENKCWNAKQANAFVNIWRKSLFSIDLARMWLNECLNFKAINDELSEYGNEFDGFKGHRHDQSIITNIMNREGYIYAPKGWNLQKWIFHDRNKQ